MNYLPRNQIMKLFITSVLLLVIIATETCSGRDLIYNSVNRGATVATFRCSINHKESFILPTPAADLRLYTTCEVLGGGSSYIKINSADSGTKLLVESDRYDGTSCSGQPNTAYGVASDDFIFSTYGAFVECEKLV
jgi:hypothetical protein